MEAATGAAALIGAISGAIVAIGALVAWLNRVFDSKIDNALVRNGLAKAGNDHQETWANGSKNLPDSINTIWKGQLANAGVIHDLKKAINGNDERTNQ